MQSKSSRTPRVCLNPHCGKTFYRKPSLKFRYCSTDCRAAGRVRPLAQRFWEKVDRRDPDDHWYWLGSLCGDGYGRISVKGRGSLKAHRVAYELAIGPIPDGLLVRHRCLYSTCVNPQHLTVGTYTENLLDRYRAGCRMVRPAPLPPRPRLNLERPCLHCGAFFKPQHQGVKYCSYAHSVAARYGNSEIDRFWAKVDKSGACWLWTGATHKFGYGLAAYQGMQTCAHRIAWLIVNGPIPDGLLVCHNCPGQDNPLCVRPDHMFLGTHTDNMQDCARKGRTTKGDRHYSHTHPEARPRGEQIPGAKMKDDLVREARRRAAAGETHQSIADSMGVTQSNITYIVRKKTWTHVH